MEDLQLDHSQSYQQPSIPFMSVTLSRRVYYFSGSRLNHQWCFQGPLCLAFQTSYLRMQHQQECRRQLPASSHKIAGYRPVCDAAVLRAFLSSDAVLPSRLNSASGAQLTCCRSHALHIVRIFQQMPLMLAIRCCSLLSGAIHHP